MDDNPEILVACSTSMSTPSSLCLRTYQEVYRGVCQFISSLFDVASQKWVMRVKLVVRQAFVRARRPPSNHANDFDSFSLHRRNVLPHLIKPGVLGLMAVQIHGGGLHVDMECCQEQVRSVLGERQW